MAKKDQLLAGINQERKGGIDALIQPTASKAQTTPEKKVSVEDKNVHCNFVMDRAYHKALKDIANNRGVPLKVVLADVIEEYLGNHKDEL